LTQRAFCLELWQVLGVRRIGSTLPAWLVASCVGALTLCSSASAAVLDDFKPPQDQALVVFIQNLRADRTMTFLVFEADRTCVAEVGGREARRVPMQPGSHTLYVSGYSTERIQLDLEAGRTYFVRLFTVQRTMSRQDEVTLVRRGTDSYMSLRSWLDGADITHASQDHCHGKPLRERKKRTIRRILEGDADWNEGGERYRIDHILAPDEGFTANELDAMTTAMPGDDGD
jgi:hypothetical protein